MRDYLLFSKCTRAITAKNAKSQIITVIILCYLVIMSVFYACSVARWSLLLSVIICDYLRKSHKLIILSHVSTGG